jgi:small subunit ribosomal protein S2
MSARTSFNELLESGAHFGHLKSKWNPAMAPYIFDERKGIHIIDLNKTAAKIEEAAAAMQSIAKSGRKVLFVATKKQAKDIIVERIRPTTMPYVTERWPGGLLTNFKTTRRTIKKMTTIEKLLADTGNTNISKRERLQKSRQKDKMAKVFGNIIDMSRLPAALFIVDVRKEDIALLEARKLGIPVFAMVDTNSDPKPIDFVIPANDDATKSIDLVVSIMAEAIQAGLNDRKAGKKSDKEDDSDEETVESTETATSEVTEEAE